MSTSNPSPNIDTTLTELSTTCRTLQTKTHETAAVCRAVQAKIQQTADAVKKLQRQVETFKRAAAYHMLLLYHAKQLLPDRPANWDEAVLRAREEFYAQDDLDATWMRAKAKVTTDRQMTIEQ